jgi:acyl-coenzyme A synthetase/AMP-(fatty) acid ligase
MEVDDVPSGGNVQPVNRVGRDVAHIIYTSGSTGLPKGVTISHENLWAGMAAVVDYLGITRGDRIASLVPFSLDYGLNLLLCCAGTGATLVVERLERCRPGGDGPAGAPRGHGRARLLWNDPETTSKVFRPHPLRPPGTPESERVVFSGDLVYEDEDGDLFFVSRKDKLLKTLGYRVSPDEVADALWAGHGLPFIIPVPCWLDYPLYAKATGLRPVPVPLRPETFDLDVAAVAITSSRSTDQSRAPER